MAHIPEYFEMGNLTQLSVEELARLVSTMYRDLARAVNQKPDLFERNTDGLSTDTFLANGSLNINSNTQKVEMLTSRPTSTTVNWTTLG